MPLKRDMTKISPPPDRETVEREIHDLMNGDLSDLARLLQKDQSIISREFNPYSDEKHNTVFQFILRLWAMDVIGKGQAGETLNIVLREREKWLPVDVREANAALLTGNIVTQFAEFIECELSGKDYNTQIKEIMDVIRAAELKKDAIIAKRNREHFGEVA